LHIAVIVPAFNVAPYVRDAIVSVVEQTHRDWSMVVVDDGSTDGTTRIAAMVPDPRISLIRQGNAGVSAARNRGIAASASDACLFLDADDWLAPDALVRLWRRRLTRRPAQTLLPADMRASRRTVQPVRCGRRRKAHCWSAFWCGTCSPMAGTC